jgi:YqaJ-like viral recombinase domain
MIDLDREAFLQARCGSLGASKIRAALATLKRSGDRTKEAVDLMFEIAAERITGVPAKRVNAMHWGGQHEEEARAAYAFLTNLAVVKVGPIPRPTIRGAHASPDALVGDDGGLEIKCPTSSVHFQTLLARASPRFRRTEARPYEPSERGAAGVRFSVRPARHPIHDLRRPRRADPRARALGRPPEASRMSAQLYTLSTGSKFDIQLNVANLREHKLAHLLTEGTIELKTETWRWRRTGKLFVEYAQSGKGSGIAVCEADLWVHQLCDDKGKPLVLLVFPLERAKELARWSWRYCGGRRRGGGDRRNVDSVVVRLHDFVRWLLKGGGA